MLGFSGRVSRRDVRDVGLEIEVSEVSLKPVEPLVEA